MNRFHFYCWFLCLAAAFGRPFAAQASSTETDLGEIVVHDRASQGSSAQDYSAFVSVIHPQDYQGEFHTTGELLERTVGVRIIDFGGLGQQQTVSIRGSSPEQVVVLLDGVRLNTAQKGGVDMASIPLEIIERIEVIRGGEAAQFGTDAIGGVVNIITKKGQSGADGKPQTNMLGSYGSFQTGKGAFFHGDKIGDFDYFLSHTHLSSEGDFPFLDTSNREAKRINNQSISESPFIRLGYEVPEIGRFEVSDQFYWAERGQPGFGESQRPFADSTNHRNLAAIRYERKKFFFDPLTLKVGAFHRLDHFDFQDPLPQIGPAISSDTTSYAYGGDVAMQYFLKPYQLLSFIVEVREDEAKVISNAAAAVNFQNFKVDRFTYALIVKDEAQFFDERFALLPTLRFEDSSEFSGQVVPKLGARFKAVKWLTFKGNISRVYRIPNFDELYFPESEFIGGNPNLVPEKGFSGDVGFEIHTKPFFFSTNVFYTRLSQAIFFVPISATRIEPINFNDDAISQGVEVAVDYDPIAYLGLHADYTFLDHYFATTKFLLPGRANHNAHFRIVGKLPPWLRVYVEGQYLSEFAVVLAAAGGQLEPQRFVMNTGFSVTPISFLTLSFDVKDVNNARGINDSRDIPLPERRYFASAELKF